MNLPGPLTDSTGGTASPTTVAALGSAAVWADAVASIADDTATLAVTLNSLLDAYKGLARRLESLEGQR